ncbi:MAG: MBOAT family protein [Methanobacteriota archaeon]|nr:MAG: MBOAT family protein [Euryarchaeota archaeon]
MDFVTTEYYQFFLPIVFLLTIFIASGKRKNQLIILLLSSYVFFWFASGWHIILLLISTCVDWTAGSKISKTNEKIIRKRWLLASLITNLGLLGIFKYLDFIIESLNLVTLKFSESLELGTIGLILPVGISFYTFQTMSYTIDIYRRKQDPYDSFIDFACYAAFFPQLVAGPIVRSDHFREDIKKPLSINSSKFKLGVTLIIYGVAKKMVIADNVAVHANLIFVEGEHLANIGLIWWATLCFGIQIYCDFSAYSDIAIGSAHLMGVKIPENFKTPYAATSPQDFWRRWHISLSTWLRDYLYIPLGGSRNGTKKMIFALMMTMLLGGLWHGASWNFILWGFVHGLLLIIHRFGKELSPVKIFFNNTGRLGILVSWVITQICIFFTWLIFRVEEIAILVPSMKTFFGINGYFDMKEMYDYLPEIKLLTAIIVFSFVLLHGISGKLGRGKIWLSERNPIIWGIICGVMLTLAFYLRPVETVDFIYFRF